MKIEERIRALTGARVTRLERIQSLWDGYGSLFRAHLEGGETVIVKSVVAPADAHPRKCKSYDVETSFYRHFAPRCDDSCRVAKLVACEGRWLTVLEDLDAAGFSGRRRVPRDRDLDACLRWLASFHARFLGEKPEGLWKEGTYWHLATRQDELAATRDASIVARAPIVDRALSHAKFRTLVHGDAKPENFCFARDNVAAVDFQYVGGGCGMKDVAYLLHGESARTQSQSLDAYFAYLDHRDVEQEWRALYPLAVEDFERFLAGWRKI